MLTGKQRAFLRSVAAREDTIIHVGKGGLTDNLVTQVKDALKAREIVKGKVQDNTLLTAREVCTQLAALCAAEEVQSIGSKFVLYRENREIDKEKRIKLPK